jgi:sugar phosphate isomerase/epimerase
MIYVSSSCVHNTRISDSVNELAKLGFKNIELSGGTEYYEGFEQDLLELKDKYNLNYLCHNYFPPPQKHFVLNLASLDDEIYRMSIEHLKKAVTLSKLLGASKFGFHAGFFIDINTSEIGKKISKKEINCAEKALDRFISGYNEVLNYSDGLKLYLENNVFSGTNYVTYNGENIFMLCSHSTYHELSEKIKFNLLLDIAHLKVSSNTLGLDFRSELKHMLALSDYLHISSNDGINDLNQSLSSDSELISLLQTCELKEKDVTLEIYENIDAIFDSCRILEELGL